jgi:hypothetical protein
VLALLFVVNVSSSSQLSVVAQTVVAEEEDFLAEILAEQAREEEELARLEAEVKEYEALQHARKQQQQQQQQHYPGGGMPGGGSGSKMKMGKGKGSSFASKLEEELAKKMEAEAAAKAATDEETKIKTNSKQDDEEAERIRLQREKAYEIQLQQMNTEQRNKAKKQKAIDAKIVSRIIKYYKLQKYYSVLGITNMEIQLGPYYIFNTITIGPYRLLHIPTKEIKRIYRNVAKIVHPDKNCDGRAVEAFHALEESAAIVTNDKLRTEYDQRIVALRRYKYEQIWRSIVHVCAIGWKKSTVSYQLVKHILGPFMTPILIITALII